MANAFEAVLPLQRLAHQLIEGETQLVMSSEWQYSPFIYNQVRDMPELILIGFPASESTNALVLPLAGHELGHSVWLNRDLEDKYDFLSADRLTDVILNRWADLEKYLHGVKKEDIKTTPLSPRILIPQRWALNQCQEIFCDFIGLGLFGRAYIFAFAYLLGPGIPGTRSVWYPSTLDRVRYIKAAAERFKVEVPDSFGKAYTDSEGLSDQEAREFCSAADLAVAALIDNLLDDAEGLLQAGGIRLPSEAGMASVLEEEAMEIVNAFRHLVPAPDPKDLRAVLNAAWAWIEGGYTWDAYPQVAKRGQTDVLNELTLKTLEVLQINYELDKHGIHRGVGPRSASGENAALEAE